MRFLSMIRLNENTGQAPSEQLMNDMGKLIEEMTRNGSLVNTAGLRPTKEGARVRSRHGKLSTTQGPFTETKEVIGGYALCEFATRDEALAFATKFMDLHRIHWPEFEGELELRPIEESVTPSLETEAARAAQPT